jgi:primary-amine oxidase
MLATHTLSAHQTTPQFKCSSVSPAWQHPLEPLSVAEITTAVSILRQAQALDHSWRIASIALQEPAKQAVLHFQPGDRVSREVLIILLDRATGCTVEALVSLTEENLIAWKPMVGVQPALLNDEVTDCETLLRSDPTFLAALQKRGITDLSLVMIDYWSVGNFGLAEERERRLVRGLCFLRSQPDENGYARPIEGVIPVIDLNRMEVLRVEDLGIVPLPPESGNFAQEFMSEFRSDLKPLEITQPHGPSFQVNGHHIRWQKWDLRIGFTPREGLVLYTVGYEDQGRIRPILYRASLAEMVVPYGDPGSHHFRKNAFDVGEYAIGMQANSLKLGCDCLGEIFYFDAVLTDGLGNPLIIPNAVCMHEEDYGILWKHTDWRTEKAEVRRSRRLVLSFFTTVGNYDYGFFWYFYQDGTIQCEAKLTGIINTAAVHPGETPKYGTLVAPQLYGLIHQHFFTVRLDFDLDGVENSIYEVHTEAEPLGEGNPYGNAFFAKSTLLQTETAAQQIVDPLSGRYWKIVNPNIHNALGQPVGYKLMPMENVLPFAHPQSSLMQRAGFLAKHLWVTPYDPAENFPAGDYPNQHAGGAGLVAWTQADRSIENTDLVVWYTFGVTHQPRPEDWPVMPVSYAGFMIKPVGFFDHNPALDVPPAAPKSKSCCHAQ